MNNFLELLERLSKPYILNKNVSLVELWTSANAIYTKNTEEIDSYVETTTPIYNNLLKIKGFPEILQKVQPTMNNVQPTVFGGKRSKRTGKRTSKRTGKRTASKRISRRKSYYGGNLVLIGATVVFGYKDLRIRNNFTFPIKFKIEVVENQIKVDLLSTQKIEEIKLFFETEFNDEYIIVKVLNENKELMNSSKYKQNIT